MSIDFVGEEPTDRGMRGSRSSSELAWRKDLFRQPRREGNEMESRRELRRGSGWRWLLVWAGLWGWGGATGNVESRGDWEVKEELGGGLWAVHVVDRVTDESDLSPGDGVCQIAGGGCTLRAALEEAVALGVGTQTIEIVANGTIELSSPLPTINNVNGLTSLLLAGPGADRLTVRRQSGGAYRIFRSAPDLLAVLDLEIRGMTIANGSDTTGGAIYNLLSNLTLRDCHLIDNTAGDGAAVYVGLANATLIGSTFSGNSSPNGAAIAFDTLGVPTTLTIENCTVSGSSRHGVRVGLAVAGSGATIRSATIAGNGGQGLLLGGNGGMVVSLVSTVLAANGGGSLGVTGSNTIVSAGYNLTDDDGGGWLTGSGDQTLADPRLAVLGMYGGTTPTRPLLPGSRAIDAGGGPGIPAQDQRGRVRVGPADVGAFESSGFTLMIGGGDQQVASLGTTFSDPLVVTVAPLVAGEPVDGGLVHFVAPSPGGGGVATIGGPVTIESLIGGGVATIGPLMAGSVEGNYQVVAAAEGATGNAVFRLRNNAPPTVLSLVALGPDPAQPGAVHYLVTFSEGMIGGSGANFSLVENGVVGSTISQVTGMGATRTVTVWPGTGSGTLRLDLIDSVGLVDQDGAPLGGLPAQGPSVVVVPPPLLVLGIERTDGSPTSSPEVAFRVTFSRPVSGLGPANFGLVGVGLPGAAILSVMGGPTSWTVRVATGVGTGTLGLNMTNAQGVTADGPIGNLPFPGELYTIVTPQVRVETTSWRETGECVGPEERLRVETSITNEAGVGQGVTLEIRVPTGLEKVPGSCPQGMAGCTGPLEGGGGVLSWSGQVAAGETIRLDYQLRVSPFVTTGAPFCLQVEVEAGGVTTGSVSHCLSLTCPPIGPGLSPPTTRAAGAQFSGSVLLYNLYHSAVGGRGEESRIALTNTHPTSSVSVQLFFLDGGTGSVAQQGLRLSPNQTFQMLAGEVDPGVTGSLLAVAVDGSGHPRRFNHLIGEVAVRFEGGAAAHLGALGIPALAGGLLPNQMDATTVTLRFDGRMYAPLGRALAISGLAAPADGQRAWLVVNRLGGDLGGGAPRLAGALFGLLYDDREMGVSFQFPSGTAQLRGLLGNHFPRTTPRFDLLIPAGRSGWMRLVSADGGGISGLLLTDHPGGFRQGHNLHVLTWTHSVVYEMPIVPLGGPSF
jgi:hypothetical protein